MKKSNNEISKSQSIISKNYSDDYSIVNQSIWEVQLISIKNQIINFKSYQSTFDISTENGFC